MLVRMTWDRLLVFGWVLFSAWSLTACASSPPRVPLLLTSHAPVKATATQLREGVVQAVKDWADAKARIEDIHTRRVTEMMAIEDDIAFLEEAAKIDAQPNPQGVGLDPGRLQRLLDLRAPRQTFEEELKKALEPPKPTQTLDKYFRNDWPTQEKTFNQAESKRAAVLWNRLRELTGADILGGSDMAAWLAKEKYTSWEEVITRFARRNDQGLVVADGIMVLTAMRAAAQELRLSPPDIPESHEVVARAIARLRHRRAQFPVVDQLLSNELTIARDLDTYLQNDVEAIHWKDLGTAIGKGQVISNDLRQLQGGQ
jgi:hypothetical protein